MASKYWIKLYHETLDDPKMGRLNDRQYRRVIELFLLAGDCEMDGRLPCMEDITFRLRYPAELEEDIEALLACGILMRNEDGELRIAGWLERQTAMSDVERSRRKRESIRSQAYFRHENATDRDIDKDIDKEKELKEDEDGSVLLGQDGEYPSFSGQSRQRCLPEANSLRGSPRSAHAERFEKPQNSGHLRHLPPQMSSDIPEPLRLPGARARGKGDAPAAHDAIPADDELVKLFVERTGLPLYLGGKEKWASALKRLHKAEVEEADLEQGIDECRSRGLTIASLASVVTPAIIARAKRKAGRPEEDYRRYLKGEYGEFGR